MKGVHSYCTIDGEKQAALTVLCSSDFSLSSIIGVCCFGIEKLMALLRDGWGTCREGVVCTEVSCTWTGLLQDTGFLFMLLDG